MRIGIDLGGTSVKAALCADDGAILIKQSVPTKTGDPDGLRADMKQLALALCVSGGVQPDEVESIGIGVPGSYDKPSCTLRFGTNLGMNDVCFAETFQPEFGCAVQLDNDANCAALGEATAGAGKNVKNMLMITLGTGVGGGIIIDGKIFEGNKSAGAEIGHEVIRMGGEKCTCGRRGCFEAYASATALIQQTKRAMQKNKDTLLWKLCENDIEKVDGKTVFDAKDAGDKTAARVVKNYIRYLAEGVTNLVNVFRPEAIVLGGGVCAQGEKLIRPLKRRVSALAYGGTEYAPVAITTASLGNDAGLCGAARLAMLKTTGN